MLTERFLELFSQTPWADDFVGLIDLIRNVEARIMMSAVPHIRQMEWEKGHPVELGLSEAIPAIKKFLARKGTEAK